MRFDFLAGDLELDQNIFARSVTQHGVDIARGNLQRLRFVFRAVNDRRDHPARLQFARRRATHRRPLFRF